MESYQFGCCAHRRSFASFERNTLQSVTYNLLGLVRLFLSSITANRRLFLRDVACVVGGNGKKWRRPRSIPKRTAVAGNLLEPFAKEAGEEVEKVESVHRFPTKLEAMPSQPQNARSELYIKLEGCSTIITIGCHLRSHSRQQ